MIFLEILASTINIKEYTLQKLFVKYSMLMRFDFNKIKMFFKAVKNRLTPLIIETVINEFYSIKDNFCLVMFLNICNNELEIDLSKCSINKIIYSSAFDFLYDLTLN